MVLRVVIDKPDPGRVETPEESVGIADCQRVSHDLSALLDVEDEFGQDDLGETYTLEVSSPGLDRALRHERDYRRFAGRLAKIVTTEPIGRQSAFAGRIKGVDERRGGPRRRKKNAPGAARSDQAGEPGC